MTMSHKNTSLDGMPNLQDFSFLQKYSLKLGIKEIGEKGTAATYKEMQQIHHSFVFEPISINKMTKFEVKRAMENLIFFNKKRDKTI